MTADTERWQRMVELLAPEADGGREEPMEALKYAREQYAYYLGLAMPPAIQNFGDVVAQDPMRAVIDQAMAKHRHWEADCRALPLEEQAGRSLSIELKSGERVIDTMLWAWNPREQISRPFFFEHGFQPNHRSSRG